MSVDEEPESFDSFPSEHAAPAPAPRHRVHVPRVRGLATHLVMFSLGIWAGIALGRSSPGASSAVVPLHSAALVDVSAESAAPAPLVVAALTPIEGLRQTVARTEATVHPAGPSRTEMTTLPSASRSRPVSEAVRRRREEQAVRSVINRYRDAVSTLNVAAVRAVWPTVEVDAVRAEFDEVLEQNVDFESCRITPDGAEAKATCVGTIEWGFVSGERRPQIERAQWQFTLRRTGQRWTITDVRMASTLADSQFE